MAPAPLHSQIERRRRRRLRLIPLIGYAIVALGLAYFFEQRPSTTVVFVRHTDTDQTLRESGQIGLRTRLGRCFARGIGDFRIIGEVGVE